MKNILSILVVSVFLFGCSKSGDSPNDINDTSGSILGTWELISGSYTETTTSSYIDPVYGTEVILNTDIDETIYDLSQYSLSWTYRYDNTYVRILNYLDSLGNPLGWGDTTIDNYTKTGNILTMEPWSSQSNVDFIITTLNNNTLSFHGTFDQGEWSDGDTTYVTEGYEELTYVKSTNGINGDIESLKKKGNSSMFISNTPTGMRRSVNR
jgi:hypothetical protein